MTEIEARRRRQTIRTLITEVFMLIVIILLVVVLAFVAMGYHIDFEKGLEHSGLVQINSIPTGAAITVDGEGVFLPTNQSRSMVSGEHTIGLERSGYTTWSKTIKVTEGMMYRLGYPRLYKEDRESSIISLALTGEASDSVPTPSRAFVSPDRKILLLTFADSTVWRYINLDDGEPTAKAIQADKTISNDFELIAWSDDHNYILIRNSGERGDWIFFNLERPEESINLTREFGFAFDSIRLETGDKLLALENGNLREINLSSKGISKILQTDIYTFANFRSIIAYVTTATTVAESTTPDDAPELYDLRIFRLGDDAPISITGLTSPDTLVSLNEYYGDLYLAYTGDQKFEVLVGRDFNHLATKSSTTLDFQPLTLSVHGDSELIVAANAEHLSVFDAESYEITTFTVESAPLWLSEHDLYTLKDGWLTAHDFDGANPHALVSGVSTLLPATISGNDRYLYYFDEALTLHREIIK